MTDMITSHIPSNIILMIQDHETPNQYKKIESISELSTLKKPYKMAVIIPPWEVSLHTVQIPKMKFSQRHQAILYSLEDQLIDKIEDLHVAYRLSPDQKTAQVAVISHKKMKEYQEVFSTMGVKPDEMITSASLIETTDPLDIQDDRLFKTILDTTDLTRLFQGKEVINLLQYSYASSNKITWDRRKNTLIFSSSLCLLSFVFILKLGFLFKLNRDLHQISKEVTSIYARYFPHATAVVSPKSRLNALLVEREKWNTEQPLLQMLDRVAQTIESTPQLQITGLQYQNQILTFTVTANDFETLNQFNQRLKKSTFSVVQKNTTSASNAVKALFEMRRQA